MSPMIVVLSTITLAASGMAVLFLLSKAFFLAPYRLGWLLMFANTVYSTLEIRLKWQRWRVDAVLFLLSVVGFAIVTPLAAAMLAIVMTLFWAATLQLDVLCRTGSGLTRQHSGFVGKAPLPVPQLIVHIRGPVVNRGAIYDLGTWLQGTGQVFTIFVLNPSVVRPQLPLSVRISTSDSALGLSGDINIDQDCPEPGDCASFPFELSADTIGAGGTVTVQVTHGDFKFERKLVLRGVNGPGARITGAHIDRWKYGASAAFAWRGDHDLYDPSTFQSEEGLRETLGLSSRFRLPSTLFMSGKLSLMQEEHLEFCNYYNWNRHSEEIPSFIDFLKQNIDRRVENEWPFVSEQPYAAEIGNHMYLHYGTHAAAEPGNSWKPRATIGDGQYEWQADGAVNSFTEQRDNLLQNTKVFRDLLDTEMITFAIPSDVYDVETARACEAAGLEVGSDTDASRFTRVMSLPPPHHPDGCESFVELTRKIPKDPQDIYSLATLKYWAHTALRHRRAFVVLSHHHLLRYEDSSCYHVTGELLRRMLSDHEGQFYVATMGAIGRYWRDVLSESQRCVTVELNDGSVLVTNGGARRLEGIPVELTFDDGSSCLRLVELDVGATIRLGGNT